MRRAIGVLAVGAALAATLMPGCARKAQPGDPLPGLSREERDRFDKGKEVFGRAFAPETGLGPLFNANSCGECHEDPAAGGRGDEVEVHASALLPGGACDDLHDAGGPVYQLHVTPALHDALGIDEEPIPARATARGRRTTPALFGFGLLDAVPEKEILAHADPDDRDGDGISGRPSRLPDGRLGRFGRKANTATLREFVAGAFLIEQGITSRDHPVEETVAGKPLPAGVDPAADPEIADREVELADAFVRFLAPPAPPRIDATILRGRAVFARLRCGACHVPVLRTGESPVAALRDRKVAAYTDLLLHDMGPGLADICLGQASPSEFRTEPLMGLRFSETFLHDGRAKSIEEAVRLHGGEATKARRGFDSLSDRDRQDLVSFLGAL